jgi:hypothetical protein
LLGQAVGRIYDVAIWTPLYEDIGMLAKELVKRVPERLVWASN